MGGTLCGRKNKYFLVHKVIRNRSIWGPCQFLILSPNTLWKTSLSIISRPLLTFPHPTILLSWIRFERGNLPFLWWNPVSPPCTCVCNLISRNGLNQYCSIQTISHGSPPLVGVPFAVDFLFSTQSNEKSVNLGTLQIFNFCHQTPCKNLFVFFLILLSCFPAYDLKGGTSLSFDETLYHRHILCMCVCNLISWNGLNQYCSI